MIRTTSLLLLLVALVAGCAGTGGDQRTALAQGGAVAPGFGTDRAYRTDPGLPGSTGAAFRENYNSGP